MNAEEALSIFNSVLALGSLEADNLDTDGSINEVRLQTNN